MFYFFKKINNKKIYNAGFSLLEILIYVSSLMVVLTIVINTSLLMSKSYLGIKLSQNINNSSILIMDRLIKEIRYSDGVDDGLSVFNSDSGVLVLSTIDDLGVSFENKFYLENGVIKMKRGLEEVVSLNTDDVYVNKFFLNLSSNDISKVIKIELELESQLKDRNKKETFYNSVVMREGY